MTFRSSFPLLCRNYFSNKFNFIACDETLWKRANLGGKSVPCGVIGQLLARGLSYLRLSNATLHSPVMKNKYGFAYNLIHPNKLIYLDLSMATFNANDLEELLSTCRHLKKLVSCIRVLSEKGRLLITSPKVK